MLPKPHILFADDDADTCEMVELGLRHAGFRVSAIGESSQVLRLHSTQRFDAVVLDNWMPGTTGLEICKQTRAVDSNTPIFFCSGAVTQADMADATAAGAQGYIEKPFDLDLLIETLRSAIQA